MKRSNYRILTTHTGSLPRSPHQQDLLRIREEQHEYDPTYFDANVRQAVADASFSISIRRFQTDEVLVD